MKRKRGSPGIAQKIMAMLLLVSILPIACIQILSYAINAATIRAQTKELIISGLEQSAHGVDAVLANYDRIIMEFYTDTSCINYLRVINSWETRNYPTAKYELTKKLQNIAYVNRDILGIAIVGIKGDSVFYDSVTLSGVSGYCFEPSQLGRSQLFRDSLSQKRTLFSTAIRKTDPVYGNHNFFYIAHQLTDFNNYQKGSLGSIILCVNEAALSSSYQQAGPNESNITFVLSNTGDIISFPDKRFIGYNIPIGGEEPDEINAQVKRFLYERGIINSEKLEINSRSIRDGRFLIINAQDLSYALKNVQYTSAMIMLIGLLVGCVCIVITLTFSGVTDRAVKTIIGAIQKMALGDYNVRIEVEGSDEFAQISNHFNDMVGRIVIANEQERNALLRQKNAELNLLEAQINPHFLYNTLDAINWVAIRREEFKISKMLTSLAAILRYSIHGSNEIVTIENEIKYLKKYVYLQQQRFNYSFQCIINIEDEVMDFRIHKLLLQPLIENSILHAFPGSSGADEINIDIGRHTEDSIKIIVADNGIGMPAELVELLNNYDYQGITQTKSIGIYNVVTRIQLYYGTLGAFRVESGKNGTSIEFCIPLEKDDIERNTRKGF